ncbi:hypothetical protein I552_4728 [Mycobacterium xenopi 3993]|nr:hypothetical protein I552_4728 [Mycobacterium xenopi 3993]
MGNCLAGRLRRRHRSLNLAAISTAVVHVVDGNRCDWQGSRQLWQIT